jgi:hypothetical protein
MTSAVRVAINAPSALISFEVDSSILVMVALWWISLLSIAAKRVSCSLSIFVIRVSCAAMRSINASILVASSLRCLSLTALLVLSFVFYVAFCGASSSGTGSVGVLLPGSVDWCGLAIQFGKWSAGWATRRRGGCRAEFGKIFFVVTDC